MKGFIKFVSIVMFGIFCFIGGVARGSGEDHVAAYCVVGGVWVLLNGYAAALEMETNELVDEYRKKNEKYLKKTKKMRRKLP